MYRMGGKGQPTVREIVVVDEGLLFDHFMAVVAIFLVLPSSVDTRREAFFIGVCLASSDTTIIDLAFLASLSFPLRSFGFSIGLGFRNSGLFSGSSSRRLGRS